MPSLVSELQALASTQSASVIELLQKCIIASVKLDNTDLADWARKELNGYGDDDVPDYRVVGGHPVVNNPLRGYQPLAFSNPDLAKACSTMNFNQPIGELEYSVQHAAASGTDSVVISYSPEFESRLRKGIQFGLAPALEMSISQFKRILDAVRTIVLEWALTLEKSGITGEGMSFSSSEKEIAKGTVFHVENYFDGGVSNSQIQIGTTSSSQQQDNSGFDVEVLREVLSSLDRLIGDGTIQPDLKTDLDPSIQTLKAQATAPAPDRTIVRIALDTVYRVLEGAAVDLAKTGLLQLIGRVFGA